MLSFFRSLAYPCFQIPKSTTIPTQRRDISISAPSKGLDLYSYISSDSRCDAYVIKFEVPGKSLISTVADNFSIKALEVEVEGSRSLVGRFQWTAICGKKEVASGWNDINALTGNVERGTMTDTKHITPFILADVVIICGFYDAGRGEAGLPNRHQCYITISPVQRDWMGSLAPPGSVVAEQPFSTFVLAAAHDPGMHDMQTMDAVMSVARVTDLKSLQKSLPQLEAFTFLPPTARLLLLPNIIYGLAYTQKKTIETMLLLGVRYFEWRPAKLLPVFRDLSGLADKFYFTHGPIPGMPTDDFLDDLVAFLDSQPHEIVVVHFRNDGIAKDCKQPTMAEITKLIEQALAKSKTGLRLGGEVSLSLSITSLRSSQTRLIFVNMAAKYDSYDDKAYATLKADPIIARFNAMNTAGQSGQSLFTILQCQATATNIKPVVVYSVLDANTGNSCLTATKARIDHSTLPWIRDNLLDRLQAKQSVVIMNDFIEGATVDIAIKLSKQRLSQT